MAAAEPVLKQSYLLESNPFIRTPGDPACRDSSEESDLIDRARGKDGEAFERLIRPHMTKAYRVAFRITGNREDAEDATQQSLLKAYMRMDQFKGESRFSTWLLRITINEALGKLRKRRAENCHLSYDMHDDETPSEIEMLRAADDFRPEVLYAKAERHRRLREAVDRLQGTTRAVVCLLGFEERQTREAAKALRLSEAAVKARFLRARQKLRECLAESN